MIVAGRIYICAVAALLAASGCEFKGHAKVDGILVPQATGVIDAEEGPTLHVPGDDLTVLPDGPVVRLAIARDVKWSEVNALLKRIEEAGKRPVLLVGKRDRVHAFLLSDGEIDMDNAVALTATRDGKSCVAPPGSHEAVCAQPMDAVRIDRAYTRKLVREISMRHETTEVDAQVSGSLSWADVVRAVDGARTCCKDRVMRVKLQR
jgi:hypothetical protein